MPKHSVLFLLVVGATLAGEPVIAQRARQEPQGFDGQEGLRMPAALPQDSATEAVAAVQTLYGIGLDLGSSGSVLYRIDNYGAASQAHVVGATGENLTDLAIDPTTGRFYATSFDGNLYELNPATGIASEVGSTGRGDLNALEFDAAGQPWAWGTFGGFYRINKEVGVATLIGDTGFDSGGDLAFDANGTLYGTTEDELIRINKNTGAGTLVGALGFEGAFGLEIAADGTMYAGRGSDFSGLAELYRVNKTTGVATFLSAIAGTSQFGLAGLSFTAASPSGVCVPSATALCLNNGRFRVEATYNTGSQNGAAQVVKLTDETGYLWFFSSANVEVVVKVLNACSLNQRYWVFSAGLTNVGVNITVTDTSSGMVQHYSNLRNRVYVTTTDTNAFATCP